MSIEVQIKDGVGANGSMAVIDKQDLPTGAMVYTEPVRDVIGQTKALVNPTYGADFNVNAAFGGTPEGVHDGTDSTLWTGTALSGTWDFASTAQAQSGTKSVDGTATVNNDEAQFEKASTISSGSYEALTFYVYLTDWSTNLSGTKEVEIRCRLAGSDVGTVLPLSSYIDKTLFDTWQQAVITVEDLKLGVQDLDQIIFKTVDIGGGAPPSYYLDEIKWQETGGATFEVIPDKQSTLTVSELNITIADAYDSTLASSSHQKIPYDSLLGLAALTNGITIRITTNEIVRFSGSFKRHIDFMGFPGMKFQSGGDGTNTWATYTVTFDPPFILDSRTEDMIDLTISEDLSGLLYARCLVRGGKEELSLV